MQQDAARKTLVFEQFGDAGQHRLVADDVRLMLGQGNALELVGLAVWAGKIAQARFSA
jgi:hypothetical protein